MEGFVNEIRNHLETRLIPFWERLKDEEHGGYYGYVDYDLNIRKDYEKGCILNSRILWFFSNAYRLLGGAAFSRMLELMAKTWRGTPSATKAFMISGMALFLKTYEPELDDQTFMDCMSAISPDEIIRRGRISSSVALRHARIIWESYNSRQSGGMELPYRFKR